MVFWMIVASIVGGVLAIGALAARHTTLRLQPDAGLEKEAARFGTKPPRATGYDQEKAIAGARRSRQHTETGRRIAKPRAQRPQLARVVSITAGKSDLERARRTG
jgi:hypothetical protein